MHNTTGFTPETTAELHAHLCDKYPPPDHHNGRPRALPYLAEIRVSLIYLRRNRTQADLAETYSVSQATISRALTTWTPRIAAALADCIPTVYDLAATESLLIDGTLAPCWDWDSEDGLYSGKHHRRGVNLQVACTPDGLLAWVSDPLPGSVHDARALDESGLLEELTVVAHLGDKGYIGKGMITPDRKPAGLLMSESSKAYNISVNSIRYQVERAIAQLKTWRILHTAYRRPFESFRETITTVLGLEFYRMSFE